MSSFICAGIFNWMVFILEMVLPNIDRLRCSIVWERYFISHLIYCSRFSLADRHSGCHTMIHTAIINIAKAKNGLCKEGDLAFRCPFFNSAKKAGPRPETPISTCEAFLIKGFHTPNKSAKMICSSLVLYSGQKWKLTYLEVAGPSVVSLDLHW